MARRRKWWWLDFFALDPTPPGLANYRPVMRKGDKHTPEAIARMAEARRAWWRRKWRERHRLAMERRRQERTIPRHKKIRPIVTLAMRIAGALEPGCWYAEPDIRILSGVSRNSLHMRFKTMRRDGLLERREVPGWKPFEYRKGEQIHLIRNRPPRYLYRLTAEGEALREVALLLG